MHFFLTLKHWHIFLTFFALSYLHLFGLPLNVNVFIILVFLSLWHYAVGIRIHSKVVAHQEQSHSIDFFKASCFLFPILWMASYWNFMLVQKSPPTSGGHIIFIIAVGSVLTYLYIIWFTSGVLIKAEPDRRQGTSQRLLMLLWLILFPIGIWFIQPKVNKLNAA